MAFACCCETVLKVFTVFESFQKAAWGIRPYFLIGKPLVYNQMCDYPHKMENSFWYKDTL